MYIVKISRIIEHLTLGIWVKYQPFNSEFLYFIDEFKCSLSDSSGYECRFRETQIILLRLFVVKTFIPLGSFDRDTHK